MNLISFFQGRKLFFSLLIIFSIIKIIDHAISRDIWQYGWWLINYENGFVRRGLIGEIIYLFSKILKGNIQLSYIFILSSLIIFFYFYLYKFINSIRFNITLYFLLLSPIFLTFHFINPKVGISTHIVFYLYYLVFLDSISSNKFNLKKNWLFIFTSPLLLLHHESIFFFLPYFIVPLVFFLKKENLNLFILQIFTLVLLFFISEFFLFINKGTPEFTKIICDSLENYKPVQCETRGPITALGHELGIAQWGKLGLFYVFDDFKVYFNYLLYLTYCFAPVIIIFYITFFKQKKIIIYSLILAILFSAPLFHFAEDWSRWFSIHFHLIAFLIFFMHKIEAFSYKNTILDKVNKFFIVEKRKILTVLLLFFYTTLLYHPHFFYPSVRLEFTYMKIYKQLQE